MFALFDKMLKSIVGSLGDGFNDYFIIILLLFTLFWFFRYNIIKLMSIKRSLSKLYKRTSTIAGMDIANVKLLDAMFEPWMHRSIRELWEDYLNDFNTGRQKDRAPDIKDYFDVQKALVIPGSRRKVEIFPGILVMIGILGTFTGIAAGLSGMELSMDTGQLQQKMSAFINIAATSFGISIAAIMLSIIYQVLDRLIYQSAIYELNRFVAAACRKIPMNSEPAALEILVAGQNKNTTAIEQLGASLNEKLTEFLGKDLIPGINETFNKVIKSQVVPSIVSMAEMLNKITQQTLDVQINGVHKMVGEFAENLNAYTGGRFKDIGAHLDSITEKQVVFEKNLSSLLELLSENASLQVNAGTESKEMLERIGDYHRQASEVNVRLAESLSKLTEFTESLGSMLEADRVMLQDTAALRESINKENKEFFEGMDGQVRKLMEDLSIQMDASFSRFNDITGMAMDRLKDTMGNALEGISGGMKGLFDSMDDQVRDISLYAKGLSEEVNELNNRLENAIGELGQQMKDSVGNTVHSFDEGLADICRRFTEVISEMKDVIEEIPGLVSSLKPVGSAVREDGKIAQG